MQVLEGPRDPLRALYARIRADSRHREVQTLTDAPAERRVFPDWSMGFAAATPADVAGLVDYADSSRRNFLLARAHNAPPALLELLRDYATQRALSPFESQH